MWQGVWPRDEEKDATMGGEGASILNTAGESVPEDCCPGCNSAWDKDTNQRLIFKCLYMLDNP